MRDESIETKLSQYNLSERHLEIVKLIRERKTNKEIANELFISENTVKCHLKTIYETLNIEQPNQAVSVTESLRFHRHIPVFPYGINPQDSPGKDE